MKNEINANNEEINKMKTVNINDIVISDSYFYQPDENVSELAKSIKELGLIHAIIVKEIDGNKYEVISGVRRLLALKYLVENEGLKEYSKVPCKVEEDKNRKIEVFDNISAREDYEVEEPKNVSIEKESVLKRIVKWIKGIFK